MASSTTLGDVLGLVAAMDAALLPLLPALPDLQAVDDLSHTSPNEEVERHSKDFMDAAKKIELFFDRVGHQYRSSEQPSREYVLRKEIAALEKELKAKDDLIQRQLQLVCKWKLMLRSQKTATVAELEKVDRTGNEPVID